MYKWDLVPELLFLNGDFRIPLDSTKNNKMKNVLTTCTVIVSLFLFGCNKNNSDNGQQPSIESITIGTQTWTLKNLDVVKYRNGDPIQQVSDPGQWASLTTGAWCYYFNNSSNNAAYGKLYNWYAVNDSRGLAPAGWHIPTDIEWTTLTTFLGGETDAGGKMKSTSLWTTPNTGATNTSGFTGLPGGGRDFGGTVVYDNGNGGVWWSSTENTSTSAWKRTLYFSAATVNRSFDGKASGYSIRCIKD